MTNRQSNIIFYGVIALIAYGLIVNHFYPDFFEDLGKSKEELSIKEAVAQGDHTQALSLYRGLLLKRLGTDKETTTDTAEIYEEMAQLHAKADDTAEAKAHYLKALETKKRLNPVNTYSVSKTYFDLGTIAERDKHIDQAQSYYEQALSTRLGKPRSADDEGIFEGLQNNQQRYKRLNNAGTIAIFNRLAALHVAKKDYTSAKNYYERALEASKLTYGEDDAKTQEVKDLIKTLPLL